MKPAAFEYLRPTSLDEALMALSRHGGDARAMAGGQSLIPMLNLRLVRPSVLVDLCAIDELLGIDRAAGFVRLGARVTHAAIEDGEVPDVANGYLAHVAAGIAYRAIRNRGTAAGSLAHADPAADWPTAMLAADASLVLSSARGPRTIALADFFTGPFTTALAEDELIAAVRIPERTASAQWAYAKQARKVGEFAQSIVAIVVDRAKGFARIAIGGIAGVPSLLPQLAATLLDGDHKASNDCNSLAALEDLLVRATAIDDPVRTRIHAATLQRAIRSLA